MAYEHIEFEIRERVAVLTIARPEVLNALSRPVLQEMSHAIDHATSAAGGARCLLLTGKGRAFCSGANLQDRGAADADALPPTGSVLESDYMPLLARIRRMDIPMVSAVNGVAAGVGMSLAMIADLVVASRSAYFLQAFARIGLVPDGGATWMLPRLIGWGRALELSMLADRLPAEKAQQWGLVNFVTEDDALMNEAFALARRLADGPASLGLIRKAYWASADNSFVEQMQLESDLQRLAGATEDNREGVRAFLEKRDARFTGQ